MSNITALEITRYESGCGYSMTVSFAITAHYDDRDTFVSSKMTARLCMDQLEGGKVAREDVRSLVRNGGRLEKVNGQWLRVA